jgi:hypothetical protein
MELLSECFVSWHEVQCNSQPVHHDEGGFPWVIPSMAKLLERVCVHRGCVLREWWDWKALPFSCIKFLWLNSNNFLIHSCTFFLVMLLPANEY